MNPADDPAFTNALLRMDSGDYTTAILLLEEAASHFPASEIVFYQLGVAYQARGMALLPAGMAAPEQPADGENLLGAVTDMAGALLGLAAIGLSRAVGKTEWIARYRDDFRRSVDALRAATRLAPDFAPALHALAQSLAQLGQSSEAAEVARRASEIEPHDGGYTALAQNLAGRAGSAAHGAGERRLTWDDLVLPERTKRELRQMQLLIERPALAAELGIEPPTGLLLYGPPGTGKTTIARVLAQESHCRFFASTPAQINSMWLGESEKQVARLFAQARASAPAIVFLDEIDALLPVRTGGVNQYSDKVVNQFLHEMDGLVRNRRIFVVGATNRRDMLDPALLRGGRLSREIEIPLPDFAGRAALLALCSRGAKLAADVDLAAIAEATDGFSGANIRALVNDAGLQALIRLSAETDTAERCLTLADFRFAMDNLRTEPPQPRSPWGFTP